jgi:hypothetical protein
MVIKLTDMSHPKNYKCSVCGANPGTWCRTRNGKVLNGFEKQHANRHYRANHYMGGQMVAGIVVPHACVRALEELDKVWPGATFPGARLAICEKVLRAAQEGRK